MKIGLSSVFVNDQDKALKFYTEVLGFIKKTDMAIGPDSRWLTVVSPDESGGVELLLEPVKGHPAAEPFQKALFESGTPFTSFISADVHKDYERMKTAGVVFRMEPTKMSYGGTDAIFEDGCGNLINIHQE